MAEKHRSISERWVVTGTLVLESPAHFGNGDADPLTDMPLLVDEARGKPLLPGTSIAGALRNYLRERQADYGKAFPKADDKDGVQKERDYWATQLFGGFRGDPEGKQSPLIVFDAVSELHGKELRDGVAIDSETRTAADKEKFDIELLAAGTEFPLQFELLVSDNGPALLNALATALHGLEKGQITLGARKRRGFGLVSVKNWKVFKYDLKQKDGLLDWLASSHDWRNSAAQQPGDTLAEKLGAELIEIDERQKANLNAKFSIDGTLLIRSGFGESDTGPDTVHLHSLRPGEERPIPVVPGTSWAGVLRHRALKIARTISDDIQAIDKNETLLWKDKEKKIPLRKADVFVDGMFGPSNIQDGDKNVKASRVSIEESRIVAPAEPLVVTRVKIDRFTGGAYEGALFSEQPAIGKDDTRILLDLDLRAPSEAELGLILLLLKDLWTGDLPIGGESGIGRGQLKGVEATLETPYGTWEFVADGEKVTVTPDAEELEKWVTEFNEEVKKAQVQA